jgi:hypothetical protein
MKYSLPTLCELFKSTLEGSTVTAGASNLNSQEPKAPRSEVLLKLRWGARATCANIDWCLTPGIKQKPPLPRFCVPP